MRSADSIRTKTKEAIPSGSPFCFVARDFYWQAAAVASGPGPTLPLALPAKVLLALVTVEVAPHGTQMPQRLLFDSVEFWMVSFAPVSSNNTLPPRLVEAFVDPPYEMSV
jgi:hypothetical protein